MSSRRELSGLPSLLTSLTGADVQCPGYSAVSGDFRFSAEALVVRVIERGSEGARVQREAVHFDPFQIHGLLIAR